MELTEDTMFGRVCAKMVEGGLITKEQLNTAEAEAIKESRPIKEIISDIAVIGPEDMAAFLEKHLDVPRVDLSNYAPEPEALQALPGDVAKEHGILPLFEIEGMLTVAMANPFDVFELDKLSEEVGWSLEPAIASSDEVQEAITECYGQLEQPPEISETAEATPDAEAAREEGEQVTELDDLPSAEELAPPAGGAIDLDALAVADDETVKGLISRMANDASTHGATHIHVEPRGDEFHVFYRTGGELSLVASAPKVLESRLIGKLRAMAGLSESESKGLRNGWISLVMDDREARIGVSFCPTAAGERAVLSLSVGTQEPVPMKELGMDEDDFFKLEFLLQQASGLILIGGPVRSGKTTTLFSCLQASAALTRTVFAVSEHVEYSSDTVNQITLSADAAYDQPAALRSLRDQDIDVLGVDEMHGIETAGALVKIAESGTLAIGTMMAHDSVGAPSMLNWYGLEPVSLASALAGVVGQTRVRALCADCKVEDESERAGKAAAVGGGGTAYKANGCKKCNGSGFLGSLVLYEVMVVDDDLRAAIAADKSEADIRKIAKDGGMSTMRRCGFRRVADGLTSVEEVLRATRHGGA